MSHRQELRLEPASEADLDVLMGWLESARDIKIWGGPEFRYPFTRETFIKDSRWNDMAAFTLRDASNDMLAFGQLYDRNGRINLARLVVRKDVRGRGLGKELITQMMKVAPALLPLDEFSLFVYRDNIPAFECYKAMGFEITECPEKHKLVNETWYMTRPVAR